MAVVEIRTGREILNTVIAIALVTFRLEDTLRAARMARSPFGENGTVQDWIEGVSNKLTDEEAAFIFEFFYRLPGGVPEELTSLFASHPEASKLLEGVTIRGEYRKMIAATE